jgi:hypothetical protein
MSETHSSGLATAQYDQLIAHVRKRLHESLACPHPHTEIDVFARMQSLLDGAKTLAEVPADLQTRVNTLNNPLVHTLFDELTAQHGEIAGFAARETRRLLLSLAAVAIHKAGEIRP